MDIRQAATLLGGRFETIASDGARALAQLALPRNARVLDVGTGAGNFAIFLALQGFDVTTGEPATDQSHYAGKDWSLNAAKVGVRDRISFEAFDASAMPFADHAFDAIFFFGVLHHVDDALREAVLREALRVVKPGGAAVYLEPGQELLSKIRIDDPSHPEPANPLDYARDLPAAASHTSGEMMDIYIFTATAEQAAS